MNAYEKLIKTMRTEGARDNPTGLVLGEVTRGVEKGLRVKIGSLTYEGDDLLVAEHLTQKSLVKLGFTIQESQGAPHTHAWTDKSEYIKPLEKGDKVVCYYIALNVYAVLERVVSV